MPSIGAADLPDKAYPGEVVAAGVTGSPITCSRGVRLVPDADWDEIDPESFDLLVLPGGGPGTERLRQDDRIRNTIQSFDAQDMVVQTKSEIA